MINHDINNIAYEKHTRFIHISPDLAQKYAQIFAHWHYLFPEVNKTVIATWRLLCLLSFKHFSQQAQFGKLGNIVGHSPVLAGVYTVTIIHNIPQVIISYHIVINTNVAPLSNFGRSCVMQKIFVEGWYTQ